jgi:hypothetical protein
MSCVSKIKEEHDRHIREGLQELCSMEGSGISTVDEEDIEAIMCSKKYLDLPHLYSAILDVMGHPDYSVRCTANNIIDDIEVIMKCNRSL